MAAESQAIRDTYQGEVILYEFEEDPPELNFESFDLYASKFKFAEREEFGFEVEDGRYRIVNYRKLESIYDITCDLCISIPRKPKVCI